MEYVDMNVIIDFREYTAVIYSSLKSYPYNLYCMSTGAMDNPKSSINV